MSNLKICGRRRFKIDVNVGSVLFKKKGEKGDVFDILASMLGSPLNITKIVNSFVSVAKKEITDDTISDFNEKTDRIDINGKAIYAAKSLKVDFIATSGSEKFYIQSALDMTSPEKQIQEKKSLYYIDDSFKKVVITKNGLGIMRDDIGVETIDLFDFLLGQEM